MYFSESAVGVSASATSSRRLLTRELSSPLVMPGNDQLPLLTLRGAAVVIAVFKAALIASSFSKTGWRSSLINTFLDWRLSLQHIQAEDALELRNEKSQFATSREKG